jgi:purine-binding chemotaxis protein CheW
MSRTRPTTVPPRTAIDWTALRQRLDAGRRRLELADAPSVEDMHRILRERARALARESKQAADPGETIEIVEFLVARERYAVETRVVCEVHALRDFAAVPGAARFILGIIHLRGEMLAVADLKRLFGLPDAGLTELDRVIVIEDGRTRLGLLANAVPGVQRVASGRFQPPPPTLTGIRAEFVQG